MYSRKELDEIGDEGIGDQDTVVERCSGHGEKWRVVTRLMASNREQYLTRVSTLDFIFWCGKIPWVFRGFAEF
jgi:hypothetical protein